MSFKIIRPKFWPFGLRAEETKVLRDADELMSTWGEAAPAVADTLSWREDVGLVHTARPGHWSRVRREIGHRLGTRDAAPSLDLAA